MLHYIIKDEAKRTIVIRNVFTTLILVSFIFLIYYNKFYNNISKINETVLEFQLENIYNDKDIRLLDFRNSSEYEIISFKKSINISNNELNSYFNELKRDTSYNEETVFVFFNNEYKEIEQALDYVKSNNIKNKVFYFYKGFSLMDIKSEVIKKYLN